LDDLVDDLSPDERRRLQRVHDLLLEAGPPADLPPQLARPPGREPLADVRVLPRGIPRRRRAAAFVLAAALAASAFGIGFLVGDTGDSGGTAASEPLVSEQNVTLQPNAEAPEAAAVVRIGARESGNLPMRLTVEGLDQLPLGDYYILYMTDKGEPVVSCGTFNVPGGNDRADIEFTVGYDLANFDGLAVYRYRNEGHKEWALMSGKLT
jgi:hypothetical protein